MKRRGFITLAGGAAAAWSLAARAQQGGRVRRVGVLMAIPNDADAHARAVTLEEGLQKLGWTVGGDIQIDYSFPGGEAERLRTAAKELAASAPDLLIAVTNPALKAARDATLSLPIVFVQVSDPVGGGFVESLDRPGGNATGFTNFEPEVGGKWLQTLKEIAPGVERVGFIFNPETSVHVGYLRAAETTSASLAVKLSPLAIHKVSEIEPAITQFALAPKGGLIIAPHPLTRGKLIIDLAAKYQLPAIYPFAFHARDGGLVSYGIDQVGQWRGAATYVDRILRGTKPADLPVQQPTKYELVINLKTAKALGLAIPESFLSLADQVIE
jgi:putative tryptophan/tyrosine transport system substrate-binding protein